MFAAAYHFGCEADNPMTALAFDARRRSRLKALFASDIGHWDVPDIREVLPEAWELVEDGNATAADFRALTFGTRCRCGRAQPVVLRRGPRSRTRCLPSWSGAGAQG